MPTFEITAPDGSVYNVDGPEGATEEQAMQQAMAQYQPQGVFQRLGNDYDQRVATAQRIADSGASGQRTMAETYPEMWAQLVAGPIVDAGKEIATSAGPTVSRWMSNATEGLPGLSSYDAAMKKTVIPAVNQGAQYVAQKYGKAEQAFPRTTDALNAIGTTVGAAANVMPALKVASEVGPTLGQAASAIKDAVTPAAEVPNITQMQSRVLAGTLYKKADDIGAVASPVFTNNKILGAINSQAPTTEAGTIGKSDAPFTKWAQDANEKLAGKPQSLTALQELDENLSDHIDKYTDPQTHLPTKEAVPFINAQQQIRASTNPANISPGDLLSGSPQALQAWKDGQGVWSDSYKLGDIERINKRASLMDNPSQARSVGYRQLAMSPKFGLYTPEQQALITQSARTGLAVRGLQFAGSGLTTIGAGLAGGPLAGLGGLVAGIPARAAADALRARPGAALGRSLSSGILDRFPDYTAAEAPADAPILQLPAPDPHFTADSLGNVRRSTTQDIVGGQVGRVMQLQNGITPGVQGNIERMSARAKTAPILDAIEASKQAAAENDARQAFGENPQNLSDLSGRGDVQNPTNAIQAAMQEALMKRGLLTPAQIHALPPQMRLNYLKSIKRQ